MSRDTADSWMELSRLVDSVGECCEIPDEVWKSPRRDFIRRLRMCMGYIQIRQILVRTFVDAQHFDPVTVWSIPVGHLRAALDSFARAMQRLCTGLGCDIGTGTRTGYFGGEVSEEILYAVRQERWLRR